MPAKAKRRRAQLQKAEGERAAESAAGNGGGAQYFAGPLQARDPAPRYPACDDRTAERCAEIADLKAREASFRLLFDGNPIPTALCEPGSYGFLAVNDAAAALWGHSREALLGMSLYEVAPREDWDEMRQRAQQGPVRAVEERMGRQLRADGTLIDVVFYWRALTFRERAAELVTFLDVTEKRRAERRLAHMACHDDLTGLPNRAFFRKSLDAALSRLNPAAGHPAAGNAGVFYLDLDQFKAVIDTLGHAAGDALLRAVAERLRAGLRPTDVLARFGGDEFAVLRSGLRGPDEASALASCLGDLVARPVPHRRAGRRDRDQHRRRHGARRRRHFGSVAEKRRHGALPRQGGGTPRLPLFRARDGRPRPRPAPA